eukprot:6116220-Pleurochrysis_carterae.AAC.1
MTCGPRIEPPQKVGVSNECACRADEVRAIDNRLCLRMRVKLRTLPEPFMHTFKEQDIVLDNCDCCFSRQWRVQQLLRE